MEIQDFLLPTSNSKTLSHGIHGGHVGRRNEALLTLQAIEFSVEAGGAETPTLNQQKRGASLSSSVHGG